MIVVLPRYCTVSTPMPVASLISAPKRCGGDPGPGAPTDRPLGFFLPCSINSATVCAGLSAGTERMLTISKNVVIGAKPFTGSYEADFVAGR